MDFSATNVILWLNDPWQFASLLGRFSSTAKKYFRNKLFLDSSTAEAPVKYPKLLDKSKTQSLSLIFSKMTSYRMVNQAPAGVKNFAHG